MYGGYHDVGEVAPLVPEYKPAATYNTAGANAREVVAMDKLSGLEEVQGGVRELAECQESLRALVGGSGAELGRVEDNMEKAHTRIDKGGDEISKAYKTRQRNRRKMCYAIGIGMCIGVVVVVALGVLKKGFLF